MQHTYHKPPINIPGINKYRVSAFGSLTLKNVGAGGQESITSLIRRGKFLQS